MALSGAANCRRRLTSVEYMARNKKGICLFLRRLMNSSKLLNEELTELCDVFIHLFGLRASGLKVSLAA